MCSIYEEKWKHLRLHGRGYSVRTAERPPGAPGSGVSAPKLKPVCSLCPPSPILSAEGAATHLTARARKPFSFP